jgi:phage-related minor tail protein
MQTLNLMGGSDFVALAAKVDQWMSDIKSTFNSHVQTATTVIAPAFGGPCTGATGAPTSSIPSDGSVAASKVKAT